MVYNGELYNTEELRRELQKKGYAFQETSDTEVLLQAFIEWKETVVERLNGIFAFAVWDKKAHRLFMARDRMGVKPLFYTLQEGAMLFASEMKALLAHPQIPAILHADGIAEIMLLVWAEHRAMVYFIIYGSLSRDSMHGMTTRGCG